MIPSNEFSDSGMSDSTRLDLSVVLPAYLEAESLRSLLPEIRAGAAALTSSYEILVVDTQERMDDTDAVCQVNGVRHIHRRGGDQYGDAVRTGIAEARGRHILFMDADGSHSPSYFAAIWAKRDIWDIVIGSRYAKGGHTENPAILIAMSYAVNLTFRFAFNIHARDVTNSLRLYRAAVLRPLRLESNDFDIVEEVLIKAALRKPPASIGEVPVTFERRKAGESKRKLVQFALGYLTTLQKLRRFALAARQEAENK
jgi:dolichol-phosphate mannosyltransferase